MITTTPLPISRELCNHLTQVLSQQANFTEDKYIIINFQNEDYSAERGGYHPIEIALTKVSDEFYSILINPKKQKTKRAITKKVIALSKRLVELAGVEPASENHSSLVLHA